MLSQGWQQGLGIAVPVATGIASSVIGANAAGNAADTQAAAANNAAALQKQAADNALAFQALVYGNQQANAAPWLQTGKSATVNLANLLGVLPKDRPAVAGTPGTPGTPAHDAIPFIGSPGQWNSLQTSLGQGFVPSPSQPYADDVQFADDATFGHNGDYRLADGSTPAGNTSGDTGIGWQTIPASPGTPGTPATAGDPGVSLSQFVNPDLGAAGSLSQGWTGKFTAPTSVTEQNDPGYQWRLDQGQKALDRSAAARGNLLSGGTAKAAQRYGQDYASNEYGQVYNRALGEYTQGYNEFQQGQTNQFNRLASMAGLGQVSAQQLSSAGTSAANNNSQTLLNSAGQIGNQLNNAAAARGSGYVGQANAITGGLNNLGSTISLLGLLRGQNNTTNNTTNNTALDPWAGVI